VGGGSTPWGKAATTQAKPSNQAPPNPHHTKAGGWGTISRLGGAAVAGAPEGPCGQQQHHQQLGQWWPG